jgi:alpha/beta superfamily hydrolase
VEGATKKELDVFLVQTRTVAIICAPKPLDKGNGQARAQRKQSRTG